MVEYLINGVFCGVLGYLIANVLSSRGEIFYFVRKIFENGTNPLDWGTIKTFFYKITVGCSKCISGQLALWSPVLLGFGFDIAGQSYGVVLAIFLSDRLSKMLN